MPYVNLPGVDLWYEDTGGDGVPVILLHAATGTTDCWVHQLPAFTTAGFRCIAYDRRTWGRSRPTDDAVQPGYQGDDLNGLIENLGLEQCHLVATAAGGITGIDYALSHPERVRSLAVANTIGGVQDKEYLDVQHRMRPPEIQNLPEHLRELGPSYRGADPEGTARWVDIEHASRPYGRLPAQPVREPITYGRLATMRVPTLVLSGQADILAPPLLMRMLAAHIPTSRFATLEDVGHAGFWERPEVWNGIVLEFIREH
ncbi:MAG: alpha/beta hydrolase [Chloroflexota bacterium]|nr:alpha/beta hydrolase [Chloroflexota bacterium]MDE2683628.1 alpha/beta hydrolase [Chloroflexota bacterium]